MPASRFAAAIALAASLLAAPVAIAAPAEQAPTATVRYGDLDLASQAGKAELRHRLTRAAAAVCPLPNLMEISTIGIATTCRAKALAGIRDKVDTAIAAAETRQRLAAITPAGRPAGL